MATFEGTCSPIKNMIYLETATRVWLVYVSLHSRLRMSTVIFELVNNWPLLSLSNAAAMRALPLATCNRSYCIVWTLEPRSLGCMVTLVNLVTIGLSDLPCRSVYHSRHLLPVWTSAIGLPTQWGFLSQCPVCAVHLITPTYRPPPGMYTWSYAKP
jgi:hypothetical protein